MEGDGAQALTVAAPPAGGRPALTPAQVRMVVIGAMLSMFLAALDQTIVATALPPIARDLGNFDLISWVITAYLVSSTSVIPVIGKASDLYGRRLTLRVCLLLFILGSVLCALAPSMILLILARALQGLGGGGLVTLAQTIVADVASARGRGKYAAYYSTVWAVASVAGPTVGGLVTARYGWPWIFWLNLPLAAIALLVSDRTLRLLPVPGRRARIDFLSIGLLSTATVALLLMLSLGGQQFPWASGETIGLGLLALVLAVLFFLQQPRSTEPLLPFRFLRHPVITPVLAASFVIYGAYLAVVVLSPVYFQVALGAPVDQAGLYMLPLMLSGTVTSQWGGMYQKRHGRYKRPPLLSLPVTILSLATAAAFATHLSLPMASFLLMLAGGGLGCYFPSSMVAGQNAVERRDLGLISGTIAYSRALGASIAVAGASALVLGIAASSGDETGRIATIQDAMQKALSPAARQVFAHAFGVVFGGLAGCVLLGTLIFSRVEDRSLGQD